MKATKRWSRNETFEINVVENCESKAHLMMKNTHKLRKVGSLIQEAARFYNTLNRMVIEKYLPSQTSSFTLNIN